MLGNFFGVGERDGMMLGGYGGFSDIQCVLHGMLELAYPWRMGEVVREVKNRGGAYSSNMLRMSGEVGRDFDGEGLLGYVERVRGLEGVVFDVNGVREGVLNGLRGDLVEKLVGKDAVWEGGVLVSGGNKLKLGGDMLAGVKRLSARDLVRYGSFMLGMSEVQGLVLLNDVDSSMTGGREQMKRDIGVLVNSHGGFLLRVLNDYVGLVRVVQVSGLVD